MTGTLLSLGHGYSARALARLLLPRGWRIIGTTRSAEKAAVLENEGIEPRIWPGTDLSKDIAAATHILANAGPGPDGDPFLTGIGAQLREARPVWVGYLSTTGVYGDHGGGWVDEDTPLAPSTERGQMRVAAEIVIPPTVTRSRNAWQSPAAVAMEVSSRGVMRWGVIWCGVM